jgi:hypothetical protein
MVLTSGVMETVAVNCVAMKDCALRILCDAAYEFGSLRQAGFVQVYPSNRFLDRLIFICSDSVFEAAKTCGRFLHDKSKWRRSQVTLVAIGLEGQGNKQTNSVALSPQANYTD